MNLPNPFHTTDSSRVVKQRNNSASLEILDLEDRVVPTAGFLKSLQGHFDTSALTKIVQVGKNVVEKKIDQLKDKKDHKQTTPPKDDGKVDPCENCNDLVLGDSKIQDGTYTLCNHPAFGYGLVLNELMKDDLGRPRTYAYDFNHPDSNIKLVLDGDTIRISGTIFGGRTQEGWNTPIVEDAGLWKVEFTYNHVTDAIGDNDKEVRKDGIEGGSGTITQLYGAHRSFKLRSDAGPEGEKMTFSFRFGNNDDGYEGYPGISGWGWLRHSGNNFEYVGGTDWHFIAKPDEMKPEDPKGGQGLTPGFWRQPHHFQYWTGFKPTDSYESVFGVNSSKVDGNFTLLQAVTAGGGGEFAMMRHAVAALLNASNPNVDYAFTTAQVISMVQSAYQTGNFEAVKNMFEAENERGGADLKK